MHDKPVNPRSRMQALRLAVFAALALMGVGAQGLAPVSARADRVVVVFASGAGHEDQRETITDAVAEAVRRLAHDAVSEAGAMGAAHHAAPEDANELRAIAEVNNAGWVVVPIVRELRANGYWLTLRVGYARDTRVEELDAEVLRSSERERLMTLLQALLRPEGVGEDAARLAGEDESARLAEERARAEAERLANEAAQEAADAEARAAREREEAQAARAEADRLAFEGRERYGAERSMLVAAGLGVHPLLRAGSRGSGGTLGTFSALFGYALGASGLELRAGLDIVFGATGGFALHGGAAYLASPFRRPIHLGAGVDLGMFMGLTGNRVPAFYVHVGGLVVYRVTRGLYLEAQLPELTVLSSNGGAVALGLSLRVGTRF